LFLGSPEFKSSITLLICLLPVRIFNVYMKYLCMTTTNKICIFFTLHLFSPPSKQEKHCLKQLKHAFVRSLIFVYVCEIWNRPRPKWLNQVKFAKAKGAFVIFSFWRHNGFTVNQLRTVFLFTNRDSKIAKRIAPSSSSSFSVMSRSFTLAMQMVDLMGLND